MTSVQGDSAMHVLNYGTYFLDILENNISVLKYRIMDSLSVAIHLYFSNEGET